MNKNIIDTGKNLVHLKDTDLSEETYDYISRKKTNIDVDSLINLSQLESPYKNEIINGLNKGVIGQQQAKEEVSLFISNALTKVGHHKGTLGNLFFHGPTGVGKTEIAKALSKHFFGTEEGFIRVNCAEFGEAHTKSRIFGAPPSYIGYGDPTIFDSKTFFQAYDIAKKSDKLNPILNKLGSFNIVVFDEIEKAHEAVIQSLLGILDEGKLTFNGTKKSPINFGNTLVIFTSNVGEQEIKEKQQESTMGFITDNSEDKDRTKIFQKSLETKFSPEFIGRIDKFVQFDKLKHNELIDIIDLNTNRFQEKVNNFFKLYPKIEINLNNEVYDHIIKNAYDEKKGARDLYRQYYRYIEAKLEILFSSKEFEIFENKKGLIKIDITEKNEELYASILYSGGNISIKEESKEKTFIDNDTLIYKLGDSNIIDINNVINLLGTVNLKTFTLYNRAQTSYIINKKKVIEQFEDLNGVYENFNGIELTGINMKTIGITTKNIEKLIDTITYKYMLNNSIDLETLKFFIFTKIFDSIKPICDKNDFCETQELMEEIIPIIIKKLKNFNISKLISDKLI